MLTTRNVYFSRHPLLVICFSSVLAISTFFLRPGDLHLFLRPGDLHLFPPSWRSPPFPPSWRSPPFSSVARRWTTTTGPRWSGKTVGSAGVLPSSGWDQRCLNTHSVACGDNIAAVAASSFASDAIFTPSPLGFYHRSLSPVAAASKGSESSLEMRGRVAEIQRHFSGM